VPQDVAVVGFDDAPAARQADPPLTTVHQPVDRMGRRMVELLLARIAGDPIADAHVLLDTHLVRRASA
jgi:DNA-binding LacI/PurR family transcriptional regulator